MGPLLIRKAILEDLDILRNISVQTFTETFAAQNSVIEMRRYLDEKMSSEILLKELLEKDAEFFLAFFDNKLAGYLKLNYSSTEEKSPTNSVQIERIYVLSDFQGIGIGFALFNIARNLAIQKNLSSIWLGVWEYNQKAIAFYEQLGFTIFGSQLFKLGTEVQNDLLMNLNFCKI